MQVTQLLNTAWVLSGIVPRSLESVSGDQVTDGLFWLNILLQDQAINGSYIPYYSYPTVNTVIGQEIYFIANAITIETATFNIQDVRYPMAQKTREQYFALPRVDNIQSLPFTYYVERVAGGSNIYLYFVPNQVYQLKLKGRYQLDDLTRSDLNVELNTTYDKFYQNYLLYALASRLCDWYKVSLPPNTAAALKSYENRVYDVNAKDVSVIKSVTACRPSGITFAQVNIGKGWVPAS